MANPVAKFFYKIKVVKANSKVWLITHKDDHQFRLLAIEQEIHSLDHQAETIPLSPLQLQ